ncbi:hypothetical protein F5X96DRAFT_662743 [Biscogniauxia mediterranea]|nr:hypothetical protein F5X96DRAFT_662743 [Biscogniauxia mediterranea]
MGRPPAFIFVVRHGKRLDAADKQWHLSSPTPYDPPLTYGGWLQSKAVGAQIASILREQEAYDAAHLKKKRRYRVILHSSPFLRCVQTSIAISAGLASNPPPFSSSSSSSPSSPLTHPGPPQAHVPPPTSPEESHHIQKTILRLDAFLGEWLSPDYFEHITPPPNSCLMLANAKAELLRREDYYDYPHRHDRIPYTNSTQLWNASPTAEHSPTPDPIPSLGLDSVSGLGRTLPEHNGHPHGDSDQKTARIGSSDHVWAHTYVAPVPTYALSSSEPIPKGYVAHARDACVNVDYQWDSTRDNLGWGDGGELPEEWAAMHQRFRRGLKCLVDWYTTTENPGALITKTAPSSPVLTTHGKDSLESTEQGRHAHEEEDEGVEIEEVVVLVSHGAGCNALIGAITHQPVLADVAMSSLTMAKRRPQFDEHVQPPADEWSAASLDDAIARHETTIPDMFELKLFASVDHLHSAVASPVVSRSASLAHDSPRGRLSNGLTSALKEINFGSYLHSGSAGGGSRSNSASASLGSMRRSSGGPSVAFRQSIFNSTNAANHAANNQTTQTPKTRRRSGSWGLWTPIHEDDDSEQALPPPSFTVTPDLEQGVAQEKDDSTKKKTEAEHPAETSTTTGHISPADIRNESACSETSHEEEHDNFNEATVPRLWAGTGNGGLWGTPRPPGEAERLRDFTASKRRWTVNERGAPPPSF